MGFKVGDIVEIVNDGGRYENFREFLFPFETFKIYKIIYKKPKKLLTNQLVYDIMSI